MQFLYVSNNSSSNTSINLPLAIQEHIKAVSFGIISFNENAIEWLSREHYATVTFTDRKYVSYETLIDDL